MSNGADLVLRTSKVWGKIFLSTKNFTAPCFTLSRLRALNNIIIASAAAVASSSSEAFVISIPVRSDITVWKFSKASSLPWDISA